MDAVADAFIRRFERPIIETAQRETFTDLSTDAARAAFTAWAHQLWDTIENHPQLAANDQIVAIPTLVRKLPEPLRKIVGDLRNTERTLVGLQLRPVRREAEARSVVDARR